MKNSKIIFEKPAKIDFTYIGVTWILAKIARQLVLARNVFADIGLKNIFLTISRLGKSTVGRRDKSAPANSSAISLFVRS